MKRHVFCVICGNVKTYTDLKRYELGKKTGHVCKGCKKV